MKRLTIVLAAALVLSACGTSANRIAMVGPLPRLTPPSPTSLRFSTASNRRFAHEDAQKLIRILELPPGARVVSKVPKTAPVRYRKELTVMRFLPGFAVTHRVWVVREPLARVVRFVKGHVHPRPRPYARFRGKNNGIRLRAVGSYQFQPIPGRTWDRWLNVDMIALSGGGTAVIAQAGDAWVHTSRHTLLPRSVRRIDIVSRFGSRKPNVLVHVHQPYQVGWIVALVNGMGLSDVERISCAVAFGGGPEITLRFRAASGKLLARATVTDPLGLGRSGPCNPVLVTVHGRKVSPRIGADLLLRLQQLLDVNLAPPLPRDVSDCLRRRGWKVESVRHGGFPPELTAVKNGRRWTITFHLSGKVTLNETASRGLEHCVRTRPRTIIDG